jgi:hypothetical protein
MAVLYISYVSTVQYPKRDLSVRSGPDMSELYNLWLAAVEVAAATQSSRPFCRQRISGSGEDTHVVLEMSSNRSSALEVCI